MGLVAIGGLLFSVCKSKQLYSENNRFLWYWSNKFRKCLCNYLFYRDIIKNKRKPPPTPPKGGECLCAHEGIRTLDSFSDNFCKILANLPPLLSEGSGEASSVDSLYL